MTDSNEWKPNDDIEDDILCIQPDGLITLAEYGRTEVDEVDETAEILNGFGRGKIANQIPQSNLTELGKTQMSQHLYNFTNLESKMGQLLTTDMIAQLNEEDKDLRQTNYEIKAMLRSSGINNFSDSDLNYIPKKNAIHFTNKKFINEKKYPILLDQEYFKFNRGIKPIQNVEDVPPQIPNDSTTEETSSATSKSDKDTSKSSSSNYIGFNELFATTSRFPQPSVGIGGGEVFLKPFEVYFYKKQRQNKSKQSSLNNNIEEHN